MAKNRDKNKPESPKEIPHLPPADDVDDVVEFVDETGAGGAAGVAGFSFEDEASYDLPTPQASDSTPSAPRVEIVPPRHPKAEEVHETDSVLDEELVNLSMGRGLDSDQVSGIFSSVIRQEPESAVKAHSEVLRAEPLSDSVPIEPISEIIKAKPDSDVRADDMDPDFSHEPITEATPAGSAVLDAELANASTGELSLPESAVERGLAHSNAHENAAIGQEIMPSVYDSSVSLKSFKSHRKAPEKEPVLDLEETLGAMDSPRPEPVDALGQTIAFEDGSSSDDVDIADLLVEDELAGSSAVNLGQKIKPHPGQSGIDPLAEALESGVRLDSSDDEIPVSLVKSLSTPSVEFDELVTEDDTVASVDLGAPLSSRPGKKSAKIPKSSFAEVADVTEAEVDVVEIDELLAADDVAVSEPLAKSAPVVDEDDIAGMLMEESELAEVHVDSEPIVEDEMTAVVEDDFEPEPAITSPKKPGKKPASQPMTDTVPMPYQEPKKRGGWGGLVGGTMLGALLTAGAGAGVWYASPDLIPVSPNATGSNKNPIVKKEDGVKNPVQVARDSIQEGKYGEAVELLKDAPEDNKSQVGMRGEARWLDYFNKKLADKAPLSKDDDEVKLALADLKKAENQIMAEQIQSVLEGKALTDEVVKLKDDLKKTTEEAEKAKVATDGFEKALKDTKLLAEGDKLDLPGFQKLAKDLGDGKVTLAQVNKLLEDAKIADPGEKGVEKLVAAKTDSETKMAEVNKLLEGEKVKDPGAKGLQEVLTNRDKLAKDREELDQTVKSAFMELVEGKFAPADADPRKEFLAATKSARTKAESPLGGPLSSIAGSLGSISFGVGDLVKNAFDDASLKTEITFFRLREGLIPTPEQQLDRLAAALQNRSEKNPAILAEGTKLAEWILSKEAQYPAETQSKAAYVQGLVSRNQDKFEDARKALKPVVDSLKDSTSPWAVQAKKTLFEIDNPSAFYLPRIEKLKADDNTAAALKELNSALAALPDDPRLTAERGLLRLEEWQRNLAAKKADAKAPELIRADAESALKDPKTAAVGNFVLGRLEETQGQLGKAEEHYRDALKLAGNDGEQAAQARFALGRILLRERGFGVAPAAPPAAEPKKKEEKDAANEKGAVNDTPVIGPKLSQVHPLTNLVLELALGQAPEVEDDDGPETRKRIQESIDLAKQLLQSKEKKTQAYGYMLLGEALSRQGQRTEGLKQYVKGLEILVPAAQISKLIEEHPAFQVPDALQRANPLLAEKHYGIGLHLFHEHKYVEAESQFRQAIAYFDKDARYFYFLGMTQMEQRTKIKRDAAYFSWEQASRLEANNRPNTAEINLSLERIQGEKRFQLNAFRGKASVNP